MLIKEMYVYSGNFPFSWLDLPSWFSTALLIQLAYY